MQDRRPIGQHSCTSRFTLIKALAFFLAAMAALPWSLPVSGSGQASQDTCSKKYRFVSVRPARGTVEQAIAVDQDGRVVLLGLGQQQTIQSVQTLGFEQSLPLEFPFAGSLPKDQVPVALRKLSCPERGWQIWIVLTIGFDEIPIRRERAWSTTFNFLYAFREGADSNTTLLRKNFHQVVKLAVDDVNGDQLTELAVEYVETGASPWTWLRVWQVMPEGTLRLVPLDNVEKDLVASATNVTIGLGDYSRGDTSVYSEQTIAMGDKQLILRKQYQWNRSEQRYQFVREVKKEETVVR